MPKPPAQRAEEMGWGRHFAWLRRGKATPTLFSPVALGEVQSGDSVSREREVKVICLPDCSLTLLSRVKRDANLLLYLLCVSKQTFVHGWASPEWVKVSLKRQYKKCYLKCWIAINSFAFLSAFCPATMKFSCFGSCCNFAFTNARQILPI